MDEGELPISRRKKVTKETKPSHIYEGEVVAPTNDQFSMYVRLDNGQQYQLYADKITWKEGEETLKTAKLKETVNNKQHFKQEDGTLMVISYISLEQIRMDILDQVYHLNKEGIKTANLIGRVIDSNAANLVNNKGNLVNSIDDKKVCLTHTYTGEIISADIDENGRWLIENLDTKVSYSVSVGNSCEIEEDEEAGLVNNVEGPDAVTEFTLNDSHSDIGNLAITDSYTFKTTFTPADKYIFSSEGATYNGTLYIENTSNIPTSGATFEIYSTDPGVEFTLPTANRVIGSLAAHEGLELSVSFTVEPFADESKIVGLMVIIEDNNVARTTRWEDYNYFKIWGSKFDLNIKSAMALGSSANIAGLVIARNQNITPIVLGSSNSKTVSLPCDTDFTYTLVFACTSYDSEGKYALGVNVSALAEDESLDAFNDTTGDETAGGNTDNNSKEHRTSVPFGERIKGYAGQGDLDFYGITCSTNDMGVQLKLTEVKTEAEVPQEIEGTPLGDMLQTEFITPELIKFVVANYGTISSDSMIGRLTHNYAGSGLNIEYAGSGGAWDGLDMKFGALPRDRTPKCSYGGRIESNYGTCQGMDQFVRVIRSDNFEGEYEEVTYNLELIDIYGYRYLVENQSMEDLTSTTPENPITFEKLDPISEVEFTDVQHNYLLPTGTDNYIAIGVLPARSIKEIIEHKPIYAIGFPPSTDEVNVAPIQVAKENIEDDQYFIPGRVYQIYTSATTKLVIRGEPINASEAFGFLHDGQNLIRVGDYTVEEYVEAVRSIAGINVYKIQYPGGNVLWDSLLSDDESASTSMNDGFGYIVHIAGANSLPMPNYDSSFPADWPAEIDVSLDVDDNSKLQSLMAQYDESTYVHYGDRQMLSHYYFTCPTSPSLRDCLFDETGYFGSEHIRLFTFGSSTQITEGAKATILNKLSLLDDLGIFDLNGDGEVPNLEMLDFWLYITNSPPWDSPSDDAEDGENGEDSGEGGDDANSNDDSSSASDDDILSSEEEYPNATRRTMGEMKEYIDNNIIRFNITISPIESDSSSNEDDASTDEDDTTIDEDDTSTTENDN